ncbi:hypothetical protein SCLCIDRAFT_1214697 [Scleroderma citrinum Foug A]|uniref:Uncharacterized protein n=1 Tax=Scleroderma citrinum Foug A TaxID=1036808 RepID=A0A0C3DQG5_9AGAM|nr:hypothetical protein SCLCIDRAFT_1214697 [Scleroderma citrinum Foug A]
MLRGPLWALRCRRRPRRRVAHFQSSSALKKPSHALHHPSHSHASHSPSSSSASSTHERIEAGSVHALVDDAAARCVCNRIRTSGHPEITSGMVAGLLGHLDSHLLDRSTEGGDPF